MRVYASVEAKIFTNIFFSFFHRANRDEEEEEEEKKKKKKSVRFCCCCCCCRRRPSSSRHCCCRLPFKVAFLVCTRNELLKKCAQRETCGLYRNDELEEEDVPACITRPTFSKKRSLLYIHILNSILLSFCASDYCFTRLCSRQPSCFS